MSRDELHNKYRPEFLEDVLGQNAIVKSLKATIARGNVRAFLFSGPFGTGKTTLARIVAMESGCEPEAITEVDAAANSGIDAMRALNDTLSFRPFGKSTSKAIIVDECHSLSKQAWQTLLKPLEEPPKHVYWMLCTTEIGKVPATVKSRCSSYGLKLISDATMEELLEKVVKGEKIKLAAGVRDVLMRSHNGSARLLLTNLSTVRDAGGRGEAADLLKQVLDTDGVLELCRFLNARGSWQKAMAIYKKIETENPEGVRIQVMNYFGSVIKGATSDAQAAKAAHVLECFCEEYTASERQAPLMLSLARCLLSK